MKIRISLAILFILVMSFSSFISYAQNNPDRYQGFIIWEDIVHPSEVEAYEKATQMQMVLYAEQNFPSEIGIYNTSENIYYWAIPIDNYADIDTLYMEFGKIYENAREDVDKIDAAFEGTLESTKSWTCYWDLDLSYMPSATEESDEEMSFCFWNFNYVKHGKMDEMKEVFKGWVDLASEKNAKQPWNTYIVDMGKESPCLFWFSTAKDAADFYSTNGKDMELMGEEAWELWRKHQSLVRKNVDQVGMIRMDLSYFLEE